jgi:anion-transporting  ArsA/GET3 family ATPase
MSRAGSARSTPGPGPDQGGNLGPVVAGRRVVLCLGSGGVGKTTTSAALALALARTGERVAVLTIDPARRLADALGLGGGLSNSPTLVAEFAAEPSTSPGRPGQVWAAMLDPAETFRRVIEAEAATPEQAERILVNRLFVNLTTTLSGTNEYMAAERLHQLAADERFDRIIVDTPPSHHVLDFLDSPGRLTRFVDHRLYRSVLAPRHGLMRPINAGARAVLRLLAGLVGSTLVDDVVDFFADFEGLDQGFRRRAAEIDALLSGPATAYLLVTTPRSDRLAEADWIVDNLERRHLRPDALIINRVLSFGGPPEGVGDDGAATLDGPLAENLAQLELLADQQAELVSPLTERVLAGRAPQEVVVVRLPEQPVPVRDLTGLTSLSDFLVARTEP